MPSVRPFSSGWVKRSHFRSFWARIQRGTSRLSMNISSIECSASGIAPLPADEVSTTGLSSISGKEIVVRTGRPAVHPLQSGAFARWLALIVPGDGFDIGQAVRLIGEFGHEAQVGAGRCIANALHVLWRKVPGHQNLRVTERVSSAVADHDDLEQVQCRAARCSAVFFGRDGARGVGDERTRPDRWSAHLECAASRRESAAAARNRRARAGHVHQVNDECARHFRAR